MCQPYGLCLLGWNSTLESFASSDTHSLVRSLPQKGTPMQPTISEFSFRYGEASATEIQGVVDEVLAELGDATSEAAEGARTAGLDPPVLASADVTVCERGQGFEPILVTILIGISIRAGSHVARNLWDDVLWPRLRRRLGANAVGEELPPEYPTNP